MAGRYRLTTEHAASSYGQPVLVDTEGNAYAPADVLPDGRLAQCEYDRLAADTDNRVMIAEAFEVVAGGPLHGTTLLADEPEALLGGLTLAEALEALSVRSGCKYSRFDWRDDIYLCPCGANADELELAERLPRFAVTLQEVER